MSFAGSIVIVNFNSRDRLRACLDSITEHAPEASVHVIDNASTDGSEAGADQSTGRVTLQRNPTNRGFAAAVNQGVERSTGELVLLLNPDCRLSSGACDALAADLLEDPQRAIAGPMVLDEDGGIQASARGDPTMFTGLFGRSTLLTRLFPNSMLARRNVRFDAMRDDQKTAVNVDWVSGACMLARRSALDEVGGFDERFFLYWEDADLCRRLRARGYCIRYVPAATVVHRAGESSRSAPVLATRAFHQSAFTYYVTHVGRSPITRGLAWLLLQARCRWKLLSGRTGSKVLAF